jgi:hypothetical protein
MPTDGETWAIDARGLTKTFGTVTAVRGVTLQVPRGTIFAFLGPNGSGKSTTLILPIRGKDLFLAKNVALMVVVAVQLMLLLAIGAWQSGFMQLGADVVVAFVLILAHLAWGNVVSVFEPRRTEPHRFTSAGDPLTASVSMLIGSTPGVAVIVLLRSDSRVTTLAIAAIVLLTVAAYYSSLRYAGRSFERRIEIISRRLA